MWFCGELNESPLCSGLYNCVHSTNAPNIPALPMTLRFDSGEGHGVLSLSSAAFLPHPPAINSSLRKHMPRQTRFGISIAHGITFPFSTCIPDTLIAGSGSSGPFLYPKTALKRLTPTPPRLAHRQHSADQPPLPIMSARHYSSSPPASSADSNTAP